MPKESELVRDIAGDLLRSFDEAHQTHGGAVAVAAVAFAAAAVTHRIEHGYAQLGGLAPALATGTFLDTYHRMLEAVREDCLQTQKRGMN